MPFGLPWSEAFISQIEDKEIRDKYVADKVRTRIALAIRALREQSDRDWSQAQLGEKMNKPQSVVSRLENPDYGKESLQTLLDVAAAFDLPLIVEIPEWDEWARRMSNMRSASFYRASFNAESLKLQAVSAKHEVQTSNVIVMNCTSGELKTGTDTASQPTRTYSYA